MCKTAWNNLHTQCALVYSVVCLPGPATTQKPDRFQLRARKQQVLRRKHTSFLATNPKAHCSKGCVKGAESNQWEIFLEKRVYSAYLLIIQATPWPPKHLPKGTHYLSLQKIWVPFTVFYLNDWNEVKTTVSIALLQDYISVSVRLEQTSSDHGRQWSTSKLLPLYSLTHNWSDWKSPSQKMVSKKQVQLVFIQLAVYV